MFNSEKVAIVISAISGAGKSSFANYLADLAYQSGRSWKIHTTDDYFTDPQGNYRFDPEKLGLAHRQNQFAFENSLKEEINLVICANTNCGADKEIYWELAKKYNYTLIAPVLQKTHDFENIHGVSAQGLEKQKNKLITGLKLI